MTQILTQDVRTARKRHVCFDCHQSIEPGTRYLDGRYANDGTAYRLAEHQDCHAAYFRIHAAFSYDDDDQFDLVEALEGHAPTCGTTYFTWVKNGERLRDPIAGACTCGKEAS